MFLGNLWLVLGIKLMEINVATAVFQAFVITISVKPSKKKNLLHLQFQKISPSIKTLQNKTGRVSIIHNPPFSVMKGILGKLPLI